jgi:hypothetical protein
LSGRVKIGLILGSVPAPDGVCLVMDVPGRVVRVQNETFYIRMAEMEHPCFVVIDPNHCMIVIFAHGISPLVLVIACSSAIVLLIPRHPMNQYRVGRTAGAQIAACRRAPFAPCS